MDDEDRDYVQAVQDAIEEKISWTDNKPEDIVVIDIETSGLSPENGTIIGISAVLLQNNKVTGLKYETWCNAPKDMGKSVLKAVGKKIGFFEDQPQLKDAIEGLELFINKRKVVSKNPSFCADFLLNAGLSNEINIQEALSIVSNNLGDGMFPWNDENEFEWRDWLEGPLQRIMPCCYYLTDHFDTLLIGKLIEISFNDNLRGQLESADWYDD